MRVILDSTISIGIAAIDSGHVSEGVFALERVLFVEPHNNAARLELARGYFLLQEDKRAKDEFMWVLRNQPPQIVHTNVQRYLDAIQQRAGKYETTVVGYVEFGFGYDTNANSAPEDGSFDSPLFGTGQLSDENLEQSDSLYQVSAGGSVNHPIAPGLSLYGGFDGYLKGHSALDDYDSMVATLKGGLKHQKGDNTHRVGIVGQRFALGGELYRRMMGATADWTHDLSKQTQLTLSASLIEMAYPDQPIRDSQQMTLGGGMTHRMAVKYSPTLFASAFRGQEMADTSSNEAKAVAERVFYGTRFGGQIGVRSNVSLDASWLIQRSEYEGINFMFLTNREEIRHQLEGGFTWLPSKHWKVRGKTGYTRSNSNIPLYEHERFLTQLSLRYDFY
ncbi:hypothetical protein BOW53_15615 [Solemya pervernicosa gill symbiont]|uniref:Surface lipoprotein assembly modifier C-terminal domain-containing protein n=1 Tax=Solemya pervernicosa gill symbiont TaxID=642797 RepID=A0A1T2L022_9GAMM|nr:surface lipoprotein assembly modifier [Solemya pervernicosa gill symbiont]OOZ38421.1 hypothetical protein BOW53_15615 [Solemya pervernicosa gill symbiont]